MSSPMMPSNLAAIKAMPADENYYPIYFVSFYPYLALPLLLRTFALRLKRLQSSFWGNNKQEIQE